jgi:hypothetical protein
MEYNQRYFGDEESIYYNRDFYIFRRRNGKEENIHTLAAGGKPVIFW